MTTTNFDLASPSKKVDGLLAVPIDIETIDAHFTFYGRSQTASADVTVTYVVGGPTTGDPIFDLAAKHNPSLAGSANSIVSQLTIIVNYCLPF